MGNTPVVSVVMPAYNAATYLPNTVQSVLEQSFKDLELLIVDDASSDHTFEVVEKLSATDSRITYIKLDENQGVANARNVGVQHSRGEYVAFLDSDDIWLPDKLKIQLTFMQQHQVDFSYCSYEVVDDHGTKIGERKISETKLDYHEMLKGNRIGLLTVMLSRKIAQKYPFPEINHEDYACWLSIARNGTVAYLASEQILGSIRLH